MGESDGRGTVFASCGHLRLQSEGFSIGASGGLQLNVCPGQLGAGQLLLCNGTSNADLGGLEVSSCDGTRGRYLLHRGGEVGQPSLCRKREG
ncbi:hypothetical protein D3C81_719680 [compost metagenome]